MAAALSRARALVGVAGGQGAPRAARLPDDRHRARVPARLVDVRVLAAGIAATGTVADPAAVAARPRSGDEAVVAPVVLRPSKERMTAGKAGAAVCAAMVTTTAVAAIAIESEDPAATQPNRVGLARSWGVPWLSPRPAARRCGQALFFFFFFASWVILFIVFGVRFQFGFASGGLLSPPPPLLSL